MPPPLRRTEQAGNQPARQTMTTTTETVRFLATAPITPAWFSATLGELELLEHLLGLKEKALEWVAEDPANRWSSHANLEPTVEWFRERGWTCVHDYKLEQARITYCEFHKDVHGIKGRWAWGWTLEECEEGIRQLGRDAATNEAWERKQEEARLAQEEFEAELLKGAPDLSPEPDLHEVYAGVFRLGA